MKYLLLFLLLPLVLFASAEDLLLQQEDPRQVIVNNRVLANVNGKPITVIDIMKRMDILFLRQFPEYTNSNSARHQFYMANWKRALSEFVDKELILADAAQSKMEVSNGDVRQEMEELFGPNIILNLDKIGLPMEEATKIVSGDIAIRRMMYVKVTSKALGKITPQTIRNFYDEWVKENVKPTIVTYRMVTVRDPDFSRGEETAKAISEKLNKGETDPEVFMVGLEPFKQTVSISEVYTQTDKEIAPANRDILLSLSAPSSSEPIKQISRAGNIVVWRIFLVSAKEEGGIPPYPEVENTLKEAMLDREVTKVQNSYIQDLRRRYALQDNKIKELIPDDFTPFTLK